MIRLLIYIAVFCLLSVGPSQAQSNEKILLATDKENYYPGEKVWMSVTALDACTNKYSFLSKIVYVELLNAANTPVYQGKVQLNDASGSGVFDVNENLATGTYMLRAYSRWMKNFDALGYAYLSLNIINPFRPGEIETHVKATDVREPDSDVAIGLRTSRTSYKKREKISLSISSNDSTRLALSVVSLDSLETGNRAGYFRQMELSCLVVNSDTVRYGPETDGQTVTAKVVDGQTQQPAAGVRGYLSVNGFPGKLFVATSDASGVIRFQTGNILSGKNELILQARDNAGRRYSITPENPFSETFINRQKSETYSPLSITSATVEERLKTSQVQKIFRSVNLDHGELPVHDTLAFYGRPDAYYLVSDYVHFATVEEILREYVTVVGVQRRNNKPYPFVQDAFLNKPFPTSPLVLMNGIPVFNLDYFMNADTDNLQSISVVNRKYHMGYDAYDGIVDVRTSAPVENFDNNATITDYQGVIPEQLFNAPAYDDATLREKRKPDFRNVLYWNPRIDINKNSAKPIEFYTSDLSGRFLILVQGITNNGKTIEEKIFIEVE